MATTTTGRDGPGEIAFDLPPGLNAGAPPERRGLRRDHVRLLVLDRTTGGTRHTRFDRLAEHLRAGDLLVLNNSRTLPAVLRGTGPAGDQVEIRLAQRRDACNWRALVLGSGPVAPGARLRLHGGLEATVVNARRANPLSTLRFSVCGGELFDALYRAGEPVRYEYVARPWHLDYYQTVFASAPGSVEMPSAGHAFTWELLLGLRRRGVEIAFLSLHTGLSYIPESLGRPDPRAMPEEFQIPAETAAAVNAARLRGGRVIAAGTTVVRALESARTNGGEVVPQSGWARIYIDRRHRLRLVDGLLTGLHEPGASHLDMLSAFVAPDLLREAYVEAIAQGYLWHEFGDANLIV